MKRIVTVGNKANIFFDMVTGITVCKGEKVTLTEGQYASSKVRSALASGHLVLVPEENTESGKEVSVDALEKKMRKMYEKGNTFNKIAGKFTLDQIKAVAEKNEVTVEEADTAEDILKAFLEVEE